MLWRTIGKEIFRQIHVSSDGSSIAALSQNGNLSFFSRTEGYRWAAAPVSPVIDFGLSQNGRFIIFGSMDQSVHVLNDEAIPIIDVKLDGPVKYVTVSNTGKQFAAVLENNTILFFNQSQTPTWALSPDIPISAVTLIQEKVIFGDISGCVYAFDNTSASPVFYSSSVNSSLGKKQTSAVITISSTVAPLGNYGTKLRENGFGIIYYLIVGIFLIGILVEGVKALKFKK